jgi:hypothetical protein
MPRVIKVRKQLGVGHEHIIGVITEAEGFFTNRTVVDAVRRGEDWYTLEADKKARIRELTTCPRCTYAPYVTTEPDNTTKNNLENLPRG